MNCNMSILIALLASNVAFATPFDVVPGRTFECFAPLKTADLLRHLDPASPVRSLRGWERRLPTPVRMRTIFNGTEISGQVEFENAGKTYTLRMGRPHEKSRFRQASDAYQTLVPNLAQHLTAENRADLIREHSVFVTFGYLLSENAQAELLAKEVESYDGRRLLAWSQLPSTLPASHPFAGLISQPFVAFEPDVAALLVSEDFATVAVCVDEDVQRESRRLIEDEMREFFGSREIRALLSCAGLL